MGWGSSLQIPALAHGPEAQGRGFPCSGPITKAPEQGAVDDPISQVEGLRPRAHLARRKLHGPCEGVGVVWLRPTSSLQGLPARIWKFSCLSLCFKDFTPPGCLGGPFLSHPLAQA